MRSPQRLLYTEKPQHPEFVFIGQVLHPLWSSLLPSVSSIIQTAKLQAYNLLNLLKIHDIAFCFFFLPVFIQQVDIFNGFILDNVKTKPSITAWFSSAALTESQSDRMHRPWHTIKFPLFKQWVKNMVRFGSLNTNSKLTLLQVSRILRFSCLHSGTAFQAS